MFNSSQNKRHAQVYAFRLSLAVLLFVGQFSCGQVRKPPYFFVENCQSGLPMASEFPQLKLQTSPGLSAIIADELKEAKFTIHRESPLLIIGEKTELTLLIKLVYLPQKAILYSLSAEFHNDDDVKTILAYGVNSIQSNCGKNLKEASPEKVDAEAMKKRAQEYLPTGDATVKNKKPNSNLNPDPKSAQKFNKEDPLSAGSGDDTFDLEVTEDQINGPE